MQTFMPFPSFEWSARCLDQKRLGKQRVENLQIMNVLLLNESGGWSNHPAVNMWRGYERALLAYQQAICSEWSFVRGFQDACWDKTRIVFLDTIGIEKLARIPLILPAWIGDVNFHISHQSNLLRKDEEHYRPWFPGIRNDHEYVWPKGKDN